MSNSTNILQHFEVAASFIPLPVCWTDLDAKILGANQAYLDLIGANDIDQLAGKSPLDYFPEEAAIAAMEHVRLVTETQLSQTRDDQICNLATGVSHCLTTIRSPLQDTDGKVVAVVATLIDFTAEKEATQPNAAGSQLLSVAERETFSNLVHKVAHDIQSPLTALSVMINVCDELSEAKRLILKNSFTAIKDIASNILNKYGTDDILSAAEELPTQILCSDFLIKSVSERKYQFQELPVKFDVQISPCAQFAFIHAQYCQMNRALTNLLSNAVDALCEREDGKVWVKLEADDKSVKFTIRDNGKGMNQTSLDNLLNRTRFTEGKQNGHGLGMMQVWEMVENNGAELSVVSEPGKGTTFELSFARSAKADWIVDEVTFRSDDIVLILDDDTLVHDAWDLRLSAIQQSMPDLIVRHEKQGQALVDYVARLSLPVKSRIYLLCDFELLHQKQHGLQIIEACNVERVILVTGYYASPALQKSAAQMGIKMLPKQMVSVVPVHIQQDEDIIDLNADEVMFDHNFYRIDQPVEKYVI